MNGNGIPDDEILPEYSLAGAVRGKYAYPSPKAPTSSCSTRTWPRFSRTPNR